MLKDPVVRNGLIAIIILLFMLANAIPLTAFNIHIKYSFISTYTGKTLYVGGNGSGNYSKIQDAIDNASNGDTIFIYNDSSPYYENIVVDKSLYLIGENSATTVIDGMKKGNTIWIPTSYVTISNLTIRNSAQNGVKESI